MKQKLTMLKPALGFADTSVANPLPTSLGFSDPRRGSAASRGYGPEWQRLRKVILKRDQYRCQECKRQGQLTAARDVDHIVKRADEGNDDPSNLQSLCQTCHKAKTARERNGGG